MTFQRRNAGLLLMLAILGVTGCESTDQNIPFEAEENQLDTYIGDIPMMPDSFVTSTFDLDANGEPVSIEFVELVKE